MLRAVLFDLDGTILDTQADFALVLNRMLSDEGRQPVDPVQLGETVSAGSRSMLKLAFQLTDDSPELSALLIRFLNDYELQHTAASLYPGVEQLLKRLEISALPWGIVTNKPRRFSSQLMPRFASFASCGSLVCPDDVGNKAKPDPTGLLRASAELGVAPEHCAYVGDHPRDIEAAHNAGMYSVAAAWGYLPRHEDPRSWGANFVAQDVDELSAHLFSLPG
jgi:2-phosphoglycolate phosphatase